jgi:hypothetical protein
MAQPTSKVALWIAVLTVALLVGGWINFSRSDSSQAFAQSTSGGKKPTPKTSNAASNNNKATGGSGNKSSSLNNGPKSQPKATIQSIPVIQQRVPIQSRT